MDKSRNEIWKVLPHLFGDERNARAPKGYLGKEVWFEINEALKPLNAEYVSAGKESRWIVRKQTSDGNV